jgi:hypothetical protein
VQLEPGSKNYHPCSGACGLRQIGRPNILCFSCLWSRSSFTSRCSFWSSSGDRIHRDNFYPCTRRCCRSPWWISRHCLSQNGGISTGNTKLSQSMSSQSRLQRWWHGITTEARKTFETRISMGRTVHSHRSNTRRSLSTQEPGLGQRHWKSMEYCTLAMILCIEFNYSLFAIWRLLSLSHIMNTFFGWASIFINYFATRTDCSGPFYWLHYSHREFRLKLCFTQPTR